MTRLDRYCGDTVDKLGKNNPAKACYVREYSHPEQPFGVYLICLLLNSIYDSILLMKKCYRCKKKKSLLDFHKRKDSKDGRQGTCKKCNIARVKQWQSKNPEKHAINWKRSTENRNEKVRKAREYNIKLEELEELFELSDGICSICKQPPTRWLVIDHCHGSLKIRGILCERCNQALGLFKDSVSSLKAAVEYLESGPLVYNEFEPLPRSRTKY